MDTNKEMSNVESEEPSDVYFLTTLKTNILNIYFSVFTIGDDCSTPLAMLDIQTSHYPNLASYML